MLADLNDKITAACRPLHASKKVTTKTVAASLKALRPLLLAWEVSEREILHLVHVVLDAVAHGEAVHGEQVEDLIREHLAKMPATAALFASNRCHRLPNFDLSATSRWDLKELQNHFPHNFFRFHQPILERPLPQQLRLHRNRFRSCSSMTMADQAFGRMEDETLSNMIRALQRRRGQEPPDIARPALI